ncbi:MAG: type IV pilus assembly protein PilF [Rhodoferax sp.]|jgi:type IV pilus assembly protein PilF
MRSEVLTLPAISRWLLWTSLCAAAVAFLSACAARPAGLVGLGAGGQDIVTASDEPDARKRARIRLELAVGYFEQGQTTIALDELKKSLVTDPAYGEAYSLRGLIYMRLNDNLLAEESFRRALLLSPHNSYIMHNLGWLLCQQTRYAEAQKLFTQALSNPQYGERAKTFMAQGLCQVRAGQSSQAEQSLLKSYEFDAGNPVTAYNLAFLLYRRGDFSRAQFYVRRLNNSELANAESFWLGIKVEQRVEDRDAMLQLAAQLLKRYPQSNEAVAYQRGNFDE